MSAAAVLVAVFIIATCGLIYELIAGTLASYVLGDSVTQFSTIIGVYLFAMGLGSWLSRFIDENLVARFIEIEIAVAVAGGGSACLLFVSFARVPFFRLILYGLVVVIGTLVGLEIPLLMRILKDRYDLKDLVARVLSADYLGALLASLAFPLFLVPELGLVRSSFAAGALNALTAIGCTYLFSGSLPRPRQASFLRFEAILCLSLLVVGFVFSQSLTTLAEEAAYADPIVLAKSSPYQRIVVTRGKHGFQLFINGNLQFASADEHRYHEALVHPVMSVERNELAPGKEELRVLILGGGDGLALRETLRYPEVQEVTLVDIDPMMTDLGKTFSLFRAQNQGAFEDPRVRVVNADALVWLDEEPQKNRDWDVIIIDFPDPNTFTLGKLYTTRFYGLVRRALAEDGALVVQATSPMLARRSFWCVVRTMEESGFLTRAYHASVPSFGEWGYVLGARRPFAVPAKLAQRAARWGELEHRAEVEGPSHDRDRLRAELEGPSRDPDRLRAEVEGPSRDRYRLRATELRFLNPESLAAMFVFPADMSRVDAEVNRLNNQILVQYYEAEWSRWN